MKTTDLSSMFDWASANKFKQNVHREVAAWGIFNADGKVRQDCSHGRACMQSIQSGEAVVVLQTCEASEDLAVRFYDWLFNRAWTAEYFQKPSDSFGRETGVVLSGTLPANVLVAAATMYRSWREHKVRVELMYDTFVDKFKCSEDLAFLAAFSFHSPNYGSLLEGWPPINTNHNAICPSEPIYWHNFMNHKIVHTTKPFNSGASYFGVVKMWGPSANFSDPEFGRKLIDSLPAKKVSLSSIVVPNPFKPVVTTQTVVTRQNIEDVFPQLMQEFEQNARTCNKRYA